MNFIKNIIEFDKLFLVWRAPHDPNRTRYVVAEILRGQGQEVTLHYLKNSEDFKKAVSFGFKEYPAFKIEQDLHNQGVLDSLMVRLPPRSRADFKNYLEILRLPFEALEISDFALLGYAGASLPSDTFSIVPSFEGVAGPCEFLMDVAGFRHIFEKHPKKIQEIKIASPVIFKAEPDNEYDAQAIQILLNGEKIGYVTRAYLPIFHHWLSSGAKVTGVIERKNENPDAQVLYVFVTVTPK